MKQNVMIIVQGATQGSESFGRELTQELQKLQPVRAPYALLPTHFPELKFITTAADGRQTATIIYYTK